MLRTHFAQVESSLLTLSEVPATSGHPLHKGSPREAFIREFLLKHLGGDFYVGTGEIIDANSRPNEPRNQVDVVVYRNDYPKLHFGGETYAFLVESVVATIEIKSVLTKRSLHKAMTAAQNVKNLQRNVIEALSAGERLPGILSYVVAFKGPNKMRTVHSWIEQSYSTLPISYPPMGDSIELRKKVASPSLDGIFVLGKGFVLFDNTPLSGSSEKLRKEYPNRKWAACDVHRGALFILFFLLAGWAKRLSLSMLNPGPYYATSPIMATGIGD